MVVGGLWRIEDGPRPPLERGWLLLGGVREDGFLVADEALIDAAAEVLYQVVLTPLGRALLQRLDQCAPSDEGGVTAVVGVARLAAPGPALVEIAAHYWVRAAQAWLLAPVSPRSLALPALPFSPPPGMPPGQWNMRVWSDLGALPRRLEAWQASWQRGLEGWRARITSEAPAIGVAAGTALADALLTVLDMPGAGGLAQARATAVQVVGELQEVVHEVAAQVAAREEEHQRAEVLWEEALTTLKEGLAVLPEPTAWWHYALLLLRPWHWPTVLRALRQGAGRVAQVELYAERLWQVKVIAVQIQARATALAQALPPLVARQSALLALVASLEGEGAEQGEADEPDPWPPWLGPAPDATQAGPEALDRVGPLGRWLDEPEALPVALHEAGRARMATVVPRTAEALLLRRGEGVDILQASAQPLGRPLPWRLEAPLQRLCLMGSTLGSGGGLEAEEAVRVATGSDDVVILTVLLGVPWSALAGAREEVGETESDGAVEW